MIIENLKHLNETDTVWLVGTGYTLETILNADNAYVHRLGTAKTKTYMLRKEGAYWTVSEVKGDRTLPYSHIGALHYLKPNNLYAGLDT